MKMTKFTLLSQVARSLAIPVLMAASWTHVGAQVVYPASGNPVNGCTMTGNDKVYVSVAATKADGMTPDCQAQLAPDAFLQNPGACQGLYKVRILKGNVVVSNGLYTEPGRFSINPEAEFTIAQYKAMLAQYQDTYDLNKNKDYQELIGDVLKDENDLDRDGNVLETLNQALSSFKTTPTTADLIVAENAAHDAAYNAAIAAGATAAAASDAGDAAAAAVQDKYDNGTGTDAANIVAAINYAPTAASDAAIAAATAASATSSAVTKAGSDASTAVKVATQLGTALIGFVSPWCDQSLFGILRDGKGAISPASHQAVMGLDLTYEVYHQGGNKTWGVVQFQDKQAPMCIMLSDVNISCAQALNAPMDARGLPIVAYGTKPPVGPFGTVVPANIYDNNTGKLDTKGNLMVDGSQRVGDAAWMSTVPVITGTNGTYAGSANNMLGFSGVSTNDKLDPTNSDDIIVKATSGPYTGNWVYATGTGKGTLAGRRIAMDCSTSTYEFIGDEVREYCDDELAATASFDADAIHEYRQETIRKWKVTDKWGNSAICSQKYVRERVLLDPATVVVPSPITISYCGNTDNLVADADGFLHPGAGYKGTFTQYLGANGAIIAAPSGASPATLDPLDKIGGTALANGLCKLSIGYTDQVFSLCGLDGGKKGSYKILRTWMIMDLCNNVMVTRAQTITMKDDVAPVIKWTATSTPYSTECKARIDFNINVTDACSKYTKLLIKDIKGNVLAKLAPGTTTYSLDVPIPGQMNPIYHNADGSLVDLTGTVPGAVAVAYTPGAGSYVPVGADTYTGTPAMSSTQTEFVIEAEDGCYNATFLAKPITIIDNLPPIAVCQEKTTVSLTSNGTARAYVTSFDSGSFDNCCLQKLEVIRMDQMAGTSADVWSDHVDFTCKDADVTVVLRATDCNGLSNTCMVNAQIQNKLKAVVVCPADVTVTCNDAYDTSITGKATIASGCGAGDPTYKDVVKSENSCGDKVINRVWSYPNSTGDCTQKITIQNDKHLLTYAVAGSNALKYAKIAPHIVFPKDTVITACATGKTTDPKSLNSNIKINYIGCDTYASGFEDIVLKNADGACEKILRKWYVLDWCYFNSNGTTHSIAWNGKDYADLDNDGKVTEPFNDLNEDGTVDSPVVDGIDAAGSTSTTDREIRHASVSEAFNYFSNGTGYDYLPYNANDVSGVTPSAANTRVGRAYGYWSWTQIIKVYDNEKPTVAVSFLPEKGDIQTPSCGDTRVVKMFTDCDKGGITFSADANDACSGRNLVVGMTIDGTAVSPTVNAGIITYQATGTKALTWYTDHLISYQISDNCGNVTSCSYTLKLTDGKKPTPVAKTLLSTTLMPRMGMVTLYARDFDNGSYDNCIANKDLSITVGRTADITKASNSIVFNCDDAKAGSATVYFFVQDAVGNWDYVQTQVVVQNNMSAPNDPVCPGTGTGQQTAQIAVATEAGDNVEQVSIINNGVTAGVTAATGKIIAAVAPNTTVKAVKDINPLNGVSTYDLVLMSKHILGVQSLSSAYNVIAADVNKSGSISASDMVELRKMILRINDKFTNNTSWRFVDKNQSLTVDNALSSTLVEEVSVSAQTAAINFVGIKVGDVNGNATPNSLLGAEVRNASETMTFEAADAAVVAGTDVSVKLAANKAVEGYQFTMSYDNKALELVGVEGLSANNYAVVENGVMTVSSNTETAEAPVFTVTFRAKKDGQLSQLLSVNSTKTVAEAYKSNADVMNVALSFSGKTANDKFELFQNQPNPFKGSTVIGFNLPETSTAKLTIFDAAGRMLKVVEGSYTKGYNEVTVNDLKASGVMYYQLSTANNTATMKMVITE